jgi:hypothetical protein
MKKPIAKKPVADKTPIRELKPKELAQTAGGASDDWETPVCVR